MSLFGIYAFDAIQYRIMVKRHFYSFALGEVAKDH